MEKGRSLMMTELVTFPLEGPIDGAFEKGR
jgi:hypothetical protein